MRWTRLEVSRLSEEFSNQFAKMRMTFSSKFLSSQEIIYIYQPDRPFNIFLPELGTKQRQSLHKYCFFSRFESQNKMYFLPFFNVCSKIGLLSVSKEKDEKTASA